MKKSNVLFLGYGVDPRRTEAVSVNTGRLMKQLKKLGAKPIMYNIGYHNPMFNTGNSMWQALFRRQAILAHLTGYIAKEKITAINDVFVLPLATLLFTLPLKKAYPQLKIIKEVHNDAGYSKKLHVETLIRFLTNQKWVLNKVLATCSCYTRNKYLAKKYRIEYLPQTLAVHPSTRKSSRVIRVGYLGHPLRKKGVYEFPELIRRLTANSKKKWVFSFAFSKIGSADEIKSLIQQAADETGTSVIFKEVVKPHDFFAKQDYYVLPLHDQFGAVSTPNTILEAMEAGAIPIVTKTPSLEGIVSDNQTGIVVTEPNSEQISRRLLALIDNPSQQKKLRKKARAFILSNFSEEGSLRKLRRIYGKK